MSLFLNEVQLNKSVPSVFAEERAARTSEKYGFIPTIDCVRGLEKAGFYPVSATQTKSRNPELVGKSKHMIRFRKSEAVEVGGVVPEIVMINSHDGSTSYQLKAGIYRLVCSNGMIVGNDMFALNIPHRGNVVEKVVEGANNLINLVPECIDKALNWQSIVLSERATLQYVKEAASLRWDTEKMDVDFLEMIKPRRMADAQNNLWTTFNMVQENLIRGGLVYRNRVSNPAIERVREHKARSVNSVYDNVRLNTKLWNLTEHFAEISA